MNSAQDDLNVSTIHQIVSESVRRGVIHTVATQDHTNSITTRQIAETLSDKLDKDANTLSAALRHRHLPKLYSTGVIKWGKCADVVTEGKNLDFLHRYLIEVEDDDW